MPVGNNRRRGAQGQAGPAAPPDHAAPSVPRAGARRPRNGRWGSIDLAYNELLDSLPSDALPDEVPTAKHMYYVNKADTIIKVDLKGKTFVVKHPYRDNVFHSILFKNMPGAAPAAWLLVRALCRFWKENHNIEMSRRELDEHEELCSEPRVRSQAPHNGGFAGHEYRVTLNRFEPGANSCIQMGASGK